MPDINLSSMRAWLNVSESRLVASSRGAALTSASAAELRKRIARARELRDKWRDVYMRQRREAQKARAARASAGNRRSREKSELFAQVLARFEARLEKVEASGAPEGTRTAAGPSRRKRTRQHRRERSRVKQSLAETVAERESAEVRSARASLPPMQTRTPPKKVKKLRTKAAAARRPSRPAAGKARDQSRSAAARHRSRMSGLTTRIRGHVSARGKRAQARRDRR